MSTTSNYLVDKTIVEDIKDFKVNKMSALRWILVIIISVIPMIIVFRLIQNLVLIIIIIFIVEIIISPSIWHKASGSVLRVLILNQLKMLSEGKEINPIIKILNSFIGLDLSEKNYFYLEASVPSIDLNSLWDLFTKRILNITSACLGISFGIAILLDFTGVFSSTNIFPLFGKVITIESAQMNMIFFITIMSTVLSLLLICWLIPLVFTTQDANLKYADIKQRTHDVGNKMSNSYLRYILGFAGLSLAFGFILDTPHFYFEFAASTIMKYIISGLILLTFICLIIGMAFLTGGIYLSKYHERVVNDFRMNLAQIIRINNTVLRELTESEKLLFKNP